MSVEEKLVPERVQCPVCPHACQLGEGQLGLCNARMGHDGQVIDQNYGRITSIALDPIEKKPLARFHNGAAILSIGSYGCNMRCPFCQNASIACANDEQVPWWPMTPDEVVTAAQNTRDSGNVGIAYTYNEPLIGYEFVRDTGLLAHEANLLNVVVTNGLINPEPLQELLPLIDAANVDLKAFTADFYKWAGGNLDCVKHTISTMAACPTCHLEVTTLVIPGLNDSDEEIAAMASWLASLDPEIPYHISRFFPCHRLTDRGPTDVAHIYHLADIARQYLTYVYTGNC